MPICAPNLCWKGVDSGEVFAFCCEQNLHTRPCQTATPKTRLPICSTGQWKKSQKHSWQTLWDDTLDAVDMTILRNKKWQQVLSFFGSNFYKFIHLRPIFSFDIPHTHKDFHLSRLALHTQCCSVHTARSGRIVKWDLLETHSWEDTLGWHFSMTFLERKCWHVHAFDSMCFCVISFLLIFFKCKTISFLSEIYFWKTYFNFYILIMNLYFSSFYFHFCIFRQKKIM